MSLFKRLGNLFSRSKLDEEIAAELRSHVEMRVEENLALVQRMCPFARLEMVQLERNAVEISWAGEDVKERILGELEAVARSVREGEKEKL